MSIRRLLPSRTDVSVPNEAEVWDLASEEADDAFEVLSSKTARKTLSSLYEEPKAASELATELNLSLQNVDYHVQNLLDAGLIEVGAIEYSETGNEMKIYAPSKHAILLLSTESTAVRVRSLVSTLFSALLLAAVGAAFFRTVVVGWLIDVPDARVEFDLVPGTDDDDVADVDDDSPEADEDYAREAFEADTLVETINPLEHLPWLLDPGVTFLIGALFVVVVIGLLWVWNR